MGAFQSLRAQSRAWLVLGTGPAACPSSLGHSVCAILFVFVLPWCFLALLSLLNKANLLVVCVRHEHPLTQSLSWLSGEEGRVILDLIIKLRHSPRQLFEPEVKHHPPHRLLSQHCPCLSCPVLSLGLLFMKHKLKQQQHNQSV